MAKKKRLLPQATKADWPISNVITLLAWLDHSLKHEDLDYESTVVLRFNQLYTLVQIEGKLSRLWHEHGAEDKPGRPRSRWKPELFKYGSACLVYINDNLQAGISDKIAESVKTLEDEYWSRLAQPAPRRLRSTSRQNDFQVPQATSGTVQTTTRTPQKQKHRPFSNSLTPSVIKREVGLIHSPAERTESSKKRKRRVLEKPARSHQVNKRRPTSHQRPKRSPISNPSHSDSRPVVEDSDDELSDILSEDLEDCRQDRDEIRIIRCICGAAERKLSHTSTAQKSPNSGCIPCEICGLWQHVTCVQDGWGGGASPESYLCELCEPKANKNNYDRRFSSHTVDEDPSRRALQTPEFVSVAPTARDGQTMTTTCSPYPRERSIMGIDTRLESAKFKMNDLEAELLESKLDVSDRDAAVVALERQIALMRAAQKLRDAQSELPIEYLIEQKLTKDKIMLENQKFREDRSKFTTLTSTSREWFGTTKVDEGFYDVYSQSRQILCPPDNDSVPCVPDLVKYQELKTLVCKCLAISTNSSKQLQEAICELVKFSPEVVVRSLITSALAEWVFETDFPKFDDCSSEILTRYRELLVAQDGAVTLRNLDLAARDNLTKSRIFRQQKIPDAAKNLAIRLSQILAPLFSDTPESTEESDWDGFATWRDNREEWMDRRKRFAQMFKFALETKADSCLNIQDYEMLIFPPGTMFDKKTMDVETSTCMSDPAKNYQGRSVVLCIEAAVFAHPRQQLSEDSLVSEAIVSSNNFVSKDKEQRIGIDPAVRAVVILSDK